MKVFDVHGDFLDEGKDIPTQDIEFNSTPALDLANARVTREIIDLRIKYGTTSQSSTSASRREMTPICRNSETRSATLISSLLDNIHKRLIALATMS
jgi:hypothetical protein